MKASRGPAVLALALSTAAAAALAVLVFSGIRWGGGVDIVSRPAGASLYVDGEYLGTTPLTMGGLSPGTHAIRLEKIYGEDIGANGRSNRGKAARQCRAERVTTGKIRRQRGKDGSRIPKIVINDVIS